MERAPEMVEAVTAVGCSEEGTAQAALGLAAEAWQAEAERVVG